LIDKKATLCNLPFESLLPPPQNQLKLTLPSNTSITTPQKHRPPQQAADLTPQAGLIHSEVQQHNIDDTIDRELIRHALPVMLGRSETSKERVVLEVTATNLQRSLGTMLSYHVSKHHGKEVG
jgi:glutamate synthase domain-containing protein 3